MFFLLRMRLSAAAMHIYSNREKLNISHILFAICQTVKTAKKYRGNILMRKRRTLENVLDVILQLVNS